jgi:hypothetical protein
MNHEIHPSRNRSAMQDRAAQEVEVLVASQTGSTMTFDELQKRTRPGSSGRFFA